MSHGLDRYIKRKERKEPVVEEPVAEEPVVEEPVAEEPVDQGTVTRDWRAILQSTVTSMILFPNQLAYTRKHILPNNPTITPEELKVKLGVSLGVAIVILDKLRTEKE